MGFFMSPMFLIVAALLVAVAIGIVIAVVWTTRRTAVAKESAAAWSTSRIKMVRDVEFELNKTVPHEYFSINSKSLEIPR
jgi:hypothetical protein